MDTRHTSDFSKRKICYSAGIKPTDYKEQRKKVCTSSMHEDKFISNSCQNAVRSKFMIQCKDLCTGRMTQVIELFVPYHRSTSVPTVIC